MDAQCGSEEEPSRLGILSGFEARESVNYFFFITLCSVITVSNQHRLKGVHETYLNQKLKKETFLHYACIFTQVFAGRTKIQIIFRRIILGAVPALRMDGRGSIAEQSEDPFEEEPFP